MKIEMVAREIGEHRGIEAHGIDPMLRERMRADLHRDAGRTEARMGVHHALRRAGAPGSEEDRGEVLVGG